MGHSLDINLTVQFYYLNTFLLYILGKNLSKHMTKKKKTLKHCMKKKLKHYMKKNIKHLKYATKIHLNFLAITNLCHSKLETKGGLLHLLISN